MRFWSARHDAGPGCAVDMDGTIVDSEHIAVEALRRAMRENGLPDLPDLYDRVVGKAADVVYRSFVAEFGLRLDPVSWETLKHRHHFAAADAIHPFPEAIAVFRAFECMGLARRLCRTAIAPSSTCNSVSPD